MNMQTDHSQQNHEIPCTASTPVMDLRKLMKEKIWEYLMARSQPSNFMDNEKMIDLVKRLENGLFKTATSKEEYTNLETLEKRLHILTNDNQHANSCVGTNTMIPNPGFQQVGQLNNLSSEESGINNRERKYKNQQRWLLFMRHARRCAGECHESVCSKGQKLLKHVCGCNSLTCVVPHCQATKMLLNHNRHCRDATCPVCIPVKNFILAESRSKLTSALINHSSNTVGRSTPMIVETPSTVNSGGYFSSSEILSSIDFVGLTFHDLKLE